MRSTYHVLGALALWILNLESAVQAQTVYNTPCPVLGWMYPEPTHFAGSSVIASAVAQAKSQIQAALDVGSEFGKLDDQETAFSVDVYSIHDGGNPLFTHHFTPQLLASQRTSGVASVDSDTVYRIGSVSKLWTMYIYLIAAGDESWNRPITQFVPELATIAQQQKASTNPVDYTDWDSVTIGALASHLGGIAVDAAWFPEISLEPLGVPNQGGNNHSTCGMASQGILLPCNRSQFFEDFPTQHPVTSPFNTAIYSNAAFQIIGYALETITGKSMSSLFQEFLVSPLNLKATFYTIPPTTENGIIPINTTASGWNGDAFDENPAGGYFSSINDMRTIGKAMLNSQQMSPVHTRKWMKPWSFTANPAYAVGAPWEIIRAPGDSPVTWMYTKSGGLGVYSSIVALLPDLGVGFSVLSAGANSGTGVILLSEIISTVFTPALWTEAKNEAVAIYDGVYHEESSGSNLTLVAPEVGSGLLVSEWKLEGQDVIAYLGEIFGGNLTIRLYPAGLETKRNGQIIQAWRSTFETLPQPLDPGPFSLNCVNWQLIDLYTYGGIGLDEFIFTLDGTGTKALGLESRVLSINMLKAPASYKRDKRRHMVRNI